ncbi:MAG: hypothetical protein ACJ79E_00580 [Anaeromyxobacteraceae bacterium]
MRIVATALSIALFPTSAGLQPVHVTVDATASDGGANGVSQVAIPRGDGGGAAQARLEPGGPLRDSVGALGTALRDPAAPSGLLAVTVNTLGQTLERTVDGNGTIVERLFDRMGALVAQQVVGTVRDLPVVSQSYVEVVELVRIVRDTSGSLIQVVIDPADRILSVGIFRPQAVVPGPTPSPLPARAR